MKRPLAQVALLGLLLVPVSTLPASDRDDVVKFLKDNVIGRTVATPPITSSTDQGKVEGVYEDKMTYSNLAVTENGFRFDLTTMVTETLYELDKNGKRIQPGRSLNGVRVYRYEMTERKSSGKLVGFGRFVSSTVKDDPFAGTVFLIQMRMQDKALMVQETQAGYSDFVAAKGASKAVAVEGKAQFLVKEGLLEVRYDQITFDVNPDTLERTATKDKFPTQVSKEAEKK